MIPLSLLKTALHGLLRQIAKRSLSRWDTVGQEGYEEARRVCYPDTDILLVTFCLVEPDSFSNVVVFWAQEANLDVLKNVPVS